MTPSHPLVTTQLPNDGGELKCAKCVHCSAKTVKQWLIKSLAVWRLGVAAILLYVHQNRVENGVQLLATYILARPVTTQLSNVGGAQMCIALCAVFLSSKCSNTVTDIKHGGGNVGCSHITVQCASKFH